tara:strand:- start:95 stop:199 length:105 start_codon:yes stop_codon:yes gene_type:complete
MKLVAEIRAMSGLMEVDVKRRMSVRDAMEHDWLN